MDEIKDAGNDIDNNKVLFIGSNKEKLTLTFLGWH